MNQEIQADLYKFDITGRSTIYQMAWEQLNISAKIDRIKESSDHEVKGEVTIRSTRPTSAGHIRSGRLNLTSPSARGTFARSCASRDSEVDWDKVMEQLCVAVLNKFRQGSEIEVLTGDADVKVMDKWLIEPLIQTDNPTLIYAHGSTGKSFFAQFVAVLADAGESRCGFNVERGINVLYLDWETNAKELSSRVTQIRNGLGLTGKSHILYLRMFQGLATSIEMIRSHVVENDVNLVIIDSLGSACMGEPESAAVVLTTFNAIRTLEVSSFIVDHTNKDGGLFGSVYKHNSSRQVFELKKNQNLDEDKLVLGMFHIKANNSKLMKPLGFELTFGEDSIAVTRQDVRDTPLESSMRVVDRVQNTLRSASQTATALGEVFKGMTAQEIATELDKTESHIRKLLSEGKQDGKFISLGEGRYALRIWEEETVEAWKL